MSEIVKGFIAKINERRVNTKRGPSVAYSMKIQREDGTEVDGWISTGFERPSANEGDYVKVTYAKNDRGYLDASEVKRLKNAPDKPAPAARAGRSNYAATTSANAGAGKDQYIHYQNSRTAAITAVGLMLAHDALPISGAQTKAGTAKRYDEVLALINKLTVQFYKDLETLRLLKSVADAGAEKPGADEDEEEEDADDDEEADPAHDADEEDDE